MGEANLEQIFGTYMSWKMDEQTWMISFMNGSQYMYLLEGDEKALLIDTGWGVGNLKEYVEKLTEKEIVVANTHFHPDHAPGNAEFQTVYMSKGWKVDEPSVTTVGATPFDITKLPNQNYEKILVGNGDVIDLGNRKIEVIDVKPAHCNSSLFFFDREHRMMFTGDEFESMQTIMYDNSMNPEAPYNVKRRIQNMKANAQLIKDLENEYDWLLPNHNGAPIAKSYIDDYISLADAIFAGTAVIEDKLNHPFIEMDPKAAEVCRVRYHKVSIFIKKAEVMKIYGEEKM